jgi:adenylyltransferase/sulfurtransferase
MSLSKDQIQRYSRQLILPEVGVKGQGQLQRSSVLIIGAGGLGSPAALYLAAAGVGKLGIIDREAVALSNLHRQILHGTSDLGRPKSESARQRLAYLNPEIEVVAIQGSVQAETALEMCRGYQLVLDGSDNIATRYLVNDACVLSNIPLVYGGVVGFRGQVMVIQPRRSACLRCVFPEPPVAGEIPSCQEAGVIGSVAGLIGSLMAHEALKVLLGIGEGLANRLLVFEGLTSRWREVPVRRDSACAVCGNTPTIRQPVAIEHPVCVEVQQEGAWPRSR